MSYNKSIVPGILIEFRGSLDSYDYPDCDHPKDHLYILAEIKTIECHEHEHDTLVFYGLIEERFISVYRRFIEGSIKNKLADIVA